MKTKTYYVYILTDRSGTVYTGVTNDLHRRVYEHKSGLGNFTSRYKIDSPYVLRGDSVALTREKQIEAWTRKKRIDLIASVNPKWGDLSEGWFDEPRVLTATHDTSDHGGLPERSSKGHLVRPDYSLRSE